MHSDYVLTWYIRKRGHVDFGETCLYEIIITFLRIKGELGKFRQKHRSKGFHTAHAVFFLHKTLAVMINLGMHFTFVSKAILGESQKVTLKSIHSSVSRVTTLIFLRYKMLKEMALWVTT